MIPFFLKQMIIERIKVHPRIGNEKTLTIDDVMGCCILALSLNPILIEAIIKMPALAFTQMAGSKAAPTKAIDGMSEKRLTPTAKLGL